MQKSICQVCLIGAGPGDPGLITAKGLQRLANADVVVFDALANPALLAKASDHAELIDVGKRAKNHKLTQDQTNQLLVDKACEGKFVVRLKGGDPYLFGRGAEEAIYLAEHGVTCEIVPGVTSGIAAPAAAGIPVTYRELSSTLTVVTGHEDPTKDNSAVDYAALAGMINSGGTVCFYMGVGRLQSIRDTLTKNGVPESKPVALVQWGTHPKQRSVRGNLQNIVQVVQDSGISSPAIIVVGDVAGIDKPGLGFFTDRPLFGQRIVVTRTRQQASALSDKLRDLGADVLEAPTIEIQQPDDWNQVDQTIKEINHYDWLILTSVNGVEALKTRMTKLGLDARQFANLKIAAIGDATERVLKEQLCINADLVPTRYIAESLAGELIAEHDIKGKKVLLLRADIARPALPKLLKEAGADVNEFVIYETKRAAALPEEVVDALEEGSVDWVTFTSSSTAQNMRDLLGDKAELMNKTKTASIGHITSQTIQKCGWNIDVEAEVFNIDGLVDAVVNATEKQK
ncbi:uroporphyrinogen-III C-methyltransferase [Planctomycetota bacterium]|nr:uroporphyrinogen-III C-methyltransferase [Planctomycetota bacterium]